MLSKNPNSKPGQIRGFTLIELLVVIAIVVILAALHLPALQRSKLKAQGIQCLNCHRQLAQAWRMYNDDNHDQILDSSGVTTSYQPGVWMSGTMDFNPANPSNYDPGVDIYRSPMWPYCGNNVSIFKCPSDRSYVVVNGVNKPRVRTMSMNIYLGGLNGTSGGVFNATTWHLFKKYSDLNVPGRSQIFVILDEREDSINWGNFYTDMSGAPTLAAPGNAAAYRLADLPGSYHGNACSFSFADNHCELKQWQDPRTSPPLKYETLTFNGSTETPTPRDPDVAWLQDKSTRPIK